MAYSAGLNVKEIGGVPWFLQNVTALNHGEPAVVLTNGSKYNPSFGTATFPMLDWVAPPNGGTPMPM